MVVTTSSEPTAGLPSLAGVRTDVNRLLDSYYIDATARAQALHPAYARLWKSLHAAHRAGGKRLRPYMLLLTYAGLGGTDIAAALPAAASVELLHACLLVHDDIIDRDYIRHDRPNVAGQYRTIYADHTADPLTTVHYAHSAALLGGDLLLAGAHDMLRASQLPAELRLAALELLSRAIFVVAGGELLDTEAAFVPQRPGASLRIAELKTAHYSFVTSMRMGALLAAASDTVMDTLERAGTAIGVAFQLADDLLGMFGDERVTGKSVAGDLTEGKYTYLIEQGLELSDAAGRKTLRAALGNPDVSDAMRQEAKALLVSSGAKAATEAMMDSKQAEALRLIDTVPFSVAARTQLQTLFSALVWRDA